MVGTEEITGSPSIRTQPPMLTPLINAALVGLLDEVATGAPIDVEIRLGVALEPELLTTDAVDFPLEMATTATGDVLTEDGLVPGITPVPTADPVPKKVTVAEGYVDLEDVKELEW